MPGAGRGTLAGIIDRTPQPLPPPHRPAGTSRRRSGRIPRPEPSPMTAHDTAWKTLFSFPEMVRGLLDGFVPPE